jgi:signal transduction histidine kinase
MVHLGSERLPGAIETALFRMVQEALTNVARHAQVNQALVNLTYASTQVTLQVIDQGVGFNASYNSHEHRWGLAGMQERADSINGKLEIQSAPDLGTMVELIAPLGVGAGVLQEAGDGW